MSWSEGSKSKSAGRVAVPSQPFALIPRRNNEEPLDNSHPRTHRLPLRGNGKFLLGTRDSGLGSGDLCGSEPSEQEASQTLIGLCQAASEMCCSPILDTSHPIWPDFFKSGA